MSYYDNSNLFLSGSGGEVNMAMLDNTREEILKEHIVPYEQRLVVFLDLQGFRDDIIRNYPAEAIGSLFGEFDCLKRMLEKDADDLQVTIISDSIVVSVSLDKPENLLYFFDACSFFAKPRMGKLFVAIRGGSLMASSTTKTTLFLDLLWWMLMKLAKESINQIFCVSVCLLKHSSLLENYHSLAVLAWLCCFRKVRKKNIISLIPGYFTWQHPVYGEIHWSQKPAMKLFCG